MLTNARPEDADTVLADWGVPVATATVPASAGVLGVVRSVRVEAAAQAGELYDRQEDHLALFVKRGALALAMDEVVRVGEGAEATDFVARGPLKGDVGLFDRWLIVEP